MFTPPPSPLPLPRIIITDEEDTKSERDSEFLSAPSSRNTTSTLKFDPCDRDNKRMQAIQVAAAAAIIENHERKKRVSRRTRWAVLLVPAVLILVAFTSRRVSTLGVFDDLDLDLDTNGMRIEAGVGMDNSSPEVEVEVEVEVGWRDGVVQRRHDQIHHHKRQTLSLSDPAAPTSSILITSTTSPLSSSAASSSDSASQTASPTTTLSQTQQTIPPVPDPSNPPVLPTPFPQPFDTTGSSSNVTTQTCANFFTNMTQTEAFRTCRPFSLLEQFSFEFIQAQTNLSALNTLIFATCSTSTPLATCISNMDWFASSLSSECSTELKQNNDMVSQTLLGLQSYALLRAAACLVNQQSNTYCYASAAHAASPADLYLYQLPLGIGFPVATTQPSCSTCAGSVLGLYADAVKSGNSSEGGLKDTYEVAAEEAESVCGSGYAVVGLSTTSGAGVRTSGMGREAGVLLGVAASVLLWL